MPPGGGGGSAAPAASDGGAVTTQLAMLVPSFEPGVDDVQVWTGKVELLMLTWPKDKLNELATRLILGCKGTLFLKLQLHKDEIMVGDIKGIKKIVELVGGSWGQIPLEQKFELAEKALYRCNQKADETADSYLQRCDVLWTELLARKVKLEELQAYILLRGSRLTPDDRKRIIVESGAEAGGVLEIKKVSAAIRMLGSGFFGELAGQKKDRSLKVYDQHAFMVDEVDDMETDTLMTHVDDLDAETIEILAAENDEDANLIVQFEDAMMDTLQSDPELAAFFTSYQDARKRLNDRFKARGFWPVKKTIGKGGKKGKNKSKGKQSLAMRIANSYCRLCNRRGHWKAECPERADASKDSSSAAAAAVVIPTSVAVVDEIPMEIAHLPLTEDRSPVTCCEVEDAFLGVVGNNGNSNCDRWNKGHNMMKGCKKLLQEGLRNRLRYEINWSERTPASYSGDSPHDCTQAPDNINIPQESCEGLFASSGTIGVVDLGASQSVVGSQQVPDLLSQLPASIRKQIRRTECNLVFRFGNHQTLTSRHAILFPLNREWFRVAVVTGNTPFLLSSKFLRDSIGAVIDTVDGTMWSKKLQRNLSVELSPKNLFLLDINQLWEDLADEKFTTKHVTLHVQVQSDAHCTEQTDQTDGECKRTEFVDTTKQDCMLRRESEADHQHNSSHPDTQLQSNMNVESRVGMSKEEEHVFNLGPKVPDRKRFSTSSCAVNVDHGVQRRCPEDEGIPGSSEGSVGRENTGAGEQHDVGGTLPRDNPIWSSEERDEFHQGISRSQLGRLVREPLREERETSTSKICTFRGADSGCRSQRRCSEPITEDTRIPAHQGEQEEPCRVLREEVIYMRAETRQLSSRMGNMESTDRATSPPDECEDGELKVLTADQQAFINQEITLECPEVEYEFVSAHENQNFQREFQRIYKKISEELKQVQDHSKLFPRHPSKLDLLEVMCSDESMLTNQVRLCGGKAVRFGLSEGDLQQTCHRKKLFEILVNQEPQHLWYSPECGPWCMWSLLNSMKSEQSC